GEDDDPAEQKTWRSCMPALGHTVTEDAVRAAQLSMARHEFLRAYLNRWTTALGDPVIPIDAWEALAAPEAPRPERVILALDVALQGRRDRRRGPPRRHPVCLDPRARPRHRVGRRAPSRAGGRARRPGDHYRPEGRRADCLRDRPPGADGSRCRRPRHRLRLL